jgi:ubiquinone/menaquinone biosynthesis C-methylase UbiE
MDTSLIDKKSTYSLQSFENNEAELARLMAQASLLPNLEWQIMQRHGLKQGFRVLDAGCGPGGTAMLIASRLEGRIDITGIDTDTQLLEVGRKAATEKNINIDFIEGDVYQLPFDSEFDFIICRLVFQHLSDPKQALKSLHKALKPGGRLLILDINDEWLFVEPPIPAFDQLIELGKQYQQKMGGNRLIGRSLRNLLQRAGFTDLQTDVLGLNSDMIGIDTFLHITTNFRKEIFKGNHEMADPQKLIDEIQETVHKENTFGMLGVFHVSGVK